MNDELKLEDYSHEYLLKQTRLLYIRKFTYEKNWHSTMHSHNHTELFYVISGSGSFKFNKTSYDIVPDNLIIINSNVMHTEVSNPNDPLSIFVVGIQGLEALCDINEDNRFVLLDSSENKKNIFPLLCNMFREEDENNDGHDIISDFLLKTIILYLLRQINLTATPSYLRERVSNECVQLRRYIDAHHMENLTLDDLANFAHMSKFYMIRMFKREFGVSPINYVQNRRITEGRRLLSETDMSIMQITNTLGFSSASQFTQCFKRITSMTPSEFRKSCKKREV